VAGSTLFYVAVIAATSAPTPWTRLAGQPLATVRAAALLPHGALLAKALLAAGAVSLIKTWNVMIIMAARLLVAMAREGLAPPGLMRLSARRGAPTAALSLATGLSLAGLLVGRAAIDPIIEVSSMILSLLYGASCLALWIVQRREGARALAWLTPPLGVAAAVVIGGIAFAEPAQQGPSGMLDYGLVVLWLSAGVLAWRFAPPRQPDATPRAARGAPINHDHPGPR
jgi:amino acid transporter